MERTHFLITILLAGIIAYGGTSLAGALREKEQAEEILEQLTAEKTALEEGNRSLRHALEHAGEDETIIALAREKLGLVMPEETIYKNAGN